MVAELNVTELIETRRSIRKFKPAQIPRGLIENILDLARWAPSAHNSQPWCCVVVDDKEVKEKLAEEMGKKWLSDMLKDGTPKDEAEKIVQLESWDRITKSPAVIIVCLTMKDMHKYPDARRRRAEYLTGVQSVAAYIQTLLLLAHYYGLGACWVCAPLFCQNIVRRVLCLPRGIEPQAMIVMGYADEKPLPPPRKELTEMCAFNFWSKS